MKESEVWQEATEIWACQLYIVKKIKVEETITDKYMIKLCYINHETPVWGSWKYFKTKDQVRRFLDGLE